MALRHNSAARGSSVHLVGSPCYDILSVVTGNILLPNTFPGPLSILERAKFCVLSVSLEALFFPAYQEDRPAPDCLLQVDLTGHELGVKRRWWWPEQEFDGVPRHISNSAIPSLSRH